MPRKAPPSTKEDSGGTLWDFDKPSQPSSPPTPQPIQGPVVQLSNLHYAGPQSWQASKTQPDVNRTTSYNSQPQLDLLDNQNWAQLGNPLNNQLGGYSGQFPPLPVSASASQLSHSRQTDSPTQFDSGQDTGDRTFSLPIPPSASVWNSPTAGETSSAPSSTGIVESSRRSFPSSIQQSSESAARGVGWNHRATRQPAAGGQDGNKKRMSFQGLPQDLLLAQIRSDDRSASQDQRRLPGELIRPSMPRTLHSEEYAQSDIMDGELRSTDARSDNNGSGRHKVPRNQQSSASQGGRAVLPNEKGFPIQIGSELFRLSGASIMSDAPSYFSKFFEDQLRQNEDGSSGVRTLYIDRDPSTFQDIARHLQGYHVQPQDGAHYVRLFVDAQFYSLPRLIKQLFESETFIQIGDQHFQIPRDIFSQQGDSPNYFSLGFAAFFNSPNEVFPGLDRQGLLRPPSVNPPCVPGRSGHIFSDLLHLLRGYPLHIKNSEHRAELLRDCRYFHLRGLEQKLIMHDISYNVERQKSEIVIRLQDIKQPGLSFENDPGPADRSPRVGWVNYGRPHVDEGSSYELIVEIGGENMRLDLKSMRAEFYGHAKARITSLFQVVANKMNLPINQPLGLLMAQGGGAAQPVSPGNTGLSDDKVKFRLERDAHIILDGDEYSDDGHIMDRYDYGGGDDPLAESGGLASVSVSGSMTSTPNWPGAERGGLLHPSQPSSAKPPIRKRKRRGSMDEFDEWIVRKGQWRLRVQPKQNRREQEEYEIVLYAVKIDAVSGQRGRNALRDFLS